MSLKTTVGIAAMALALVACGEKAQFARTPKSDAQAWSGTTAPAYAAPGWKPGDEASWNEQMRNRAQGQNEYARSAAQ